MRGDRIEAQLPFDLAPNSRYSFVVQRGPALSTVEEITVAPAQPAIFRKTPGSSQGVILRLDSTTAEPATPASAGENVRIQCSGPGAVTPAVAAGRTGAYEVTVTVPAAAAPGDAVPVVVTAAIPRP